MQKRGRAATIDATRLLLSLSVCLSVCLFPSHPHRAHPQQQEREREDKLFLKKRNEAIRAWKTIIKTLWHRIRLRNMYTPTDDQADGSGGGGSSSAEPKPTLSTPTDRAGDSAIHSERPAPKLEHVHEFDPHLEQHDPKSGVTIRRCRCGFSIEVRPGGRAGVGKINRQIDDE